MSISSAGDILSVLSAGQVRGRPSAASAYDKVAASLGKAQDGFDAATAVDLSPAARAAAQGDAAALLTKRLEAINAGRAEAGRNSYTGEEAREVLDIQRKLDPASFAPNPADLSGEDAQRLGALNGQMAAVFDAAGQDELTADQAAFLDVARAELGFLGGIAQLRNAYQGTGTEADKLTEDLNQTRGLFEQFNRGEADAQTLLSRLEERKGLVSELLGDLSGKNTDQAGRDRPSVGVADTAA